MLEIVQNYWDRTSIEAILPAECKENAALYASDNVETGSKINVIVARWKALCSVEGYITEGILDEVPHRTWIRVHRDATGYPDGMLFTLIRGCSMYCWKGKKISQECAVQSFTYQPGKSDGAFTFFYRQKHQKQFPLYLKEALQKPASTEKISEWNFDMQHLAPGDLEKIQAFCGNGRPYLPPFLDQALFPQSTGV